MGENLPLLPGKSAICSDVKPVLREVFREMDQLPPLSLEKTSATDDEKLWVSCWVFTSDRGYVSIRLTVQNLASELSHIEKHNLECDDIWRQEGDLKKQFAKRISKKHPQNVYRLSKPTEIIKERNDKDLLERKDLMPRIEQNPAGDQTLWIQNTLNKSSCDVINDSAIGQPWVKTEESLTHVGLDQCSRQTYRQQLLLAEIDETKTETFSETNQRKPSLSVGELAVEKLRSPARKLRTPLVPQYIRCIPDEINFVNFKPGQTYTQDIRIFNVSKFEIRVSLSLPHRRELEVELSGSRGLRMTASSITDLKVHFRPNDTRDLQDELRIRTSSGKGQVLPIKCYTVPPELHVLIHKLHRCTYSSNLDVPIKGGNVVDLGARLLGDEHRVGLVLRCDAAYATFFMLTEDAWLDLTVEELTSKGKLKAGDFTLFPSWWAGGGITNGLICCRATTTGFHKVDLRILSSTAVTRPLHVVADSIYYGPGHIIVEIPEKNRTITCDSDPNTKYTVNLGTAFPNRPLSTTLKITNNSPIPYSFYWKFRPWDTCSCWQDFQDSVTSFEVGEETERNLCPGAKLAKLDQEQDDDDADVEGTVCRVHLNPHWGDVPERSTSVVSVQVPQVGTRLGTHRVILMLIVKNIPMESFPPKFIPNIVSTRTVDEIGVDGKIWTRKVCEIVQEQLEITWEVVPVRFILLPPVVPLIHSRRIKGVDMTFTAIQLFGNAEIPACWNKSAPLVLPSKLLLSPMNSVKASLTIPLFPLPNERPDTDVITLKAETDEWNANCVITRSCATRHPAVKPTRLWLGVVPPGAKVSGNLRVFNDTHQDISWLATPYPWTGETPIRPCVQATVPCTMCYENDCVCSLLTPSRGALARGEQAVISYNVRAPTTDGCVTSLIKISRADSRNELEGGPATDARVSLVAYRVLAARLVLRVFPCGGDKKGGCNNCDLDACENPKGSAILRPSRALTTGICSCYRLKITNITPTATSVCWETAIEGEEFLKVKFSPNAVSVGSYSEKVISVFLEPRKVCERRLFVLRAQVVHAYTPLYLVIDAAVDGVQIVCEVPLCGADGNCSFMRIPKIQKELTSRSEQMRLTTPMDWFLHNDLERAARKAYCTCDESSEAPTPPSPPQPSSSRNVCKEETSSFQELSYSHQKSKRTSEFFEDTVVPEEYCLQFRNLPLRTVRTQILKLFNVGRVTARWRTIVRRWPRHQSRATTVELALASDTERWAADVRHPGVVIQCLPNNGVCAVGQNIDILVHVYADCWGAYFDQIMVMVDQVDPIILDVWIETVGSPLQFARAPSCNESEYDLTMWLSQSDPERTLRFKNISRSELTVCAYTLLEHEHTQDAYPFRLYMRFIDVIQCRCSYDSLSVSDNASRYSSTSGLLEPELMDIEFYLDDDYGYQNQEYYRVEPEICIVAPGAWMEWRIILNSSTTDEPTPPGVVMLRTIPNDNIKKCHHWRRCEPPPARIGVRAVPRAPLLRLSCSELVARLCALELHYKEVARVRKRFRVRNIGNAPLCVCCVTSPPWQIVTEKTRHDCKQCYCVENIGQRCDEVEMLLEPWSSTAVCVEVEINTEEIWPTEDDVKENVMPTYPPTHEVTGELKFINDQEILKTLPLTLVVQFPQVFLEPTMIDFGLVTYGDKRKTYMTAWHSSSTTYVDLAVSYKGNGKIRLYPRHINVAPGKQERVYIQYDAKLGSSEPVKGQVHFEAAGGAHAWCRAELAVQAQPTRDGQYHLPAHDYTDQWHLLPFKLG